VTDDDIDLSLEESLKLFVPMLDQREVGLFHFALSMPIMYMAGGAIRHSWTMFLVGSWSAPGPLSSMPSARRSDPAGTRC